MLIVCNPYAGGGKALQKWQKVEKTLQQPFEVYLLSEEKDLVMTLRAAFQSGHRLFVAAGGDGTANLLLNGLAMEFSEKEREEIVFGALPLGSSNDYHKPHGQSSFFESEKRDVLRFVLTGKEGVRKERFAFLNGSFGVTADGNASFNEPRAILSFLKWGSTHAAILFAALQAIWRAKKHRVKIEMDGDEKVFQVNNIGVIKSPFFTGDFSYRSSFKKGDGSYSLYVCHGMGLFGLLKVLWSLKRGRFKEGRKAFSVHLDETKSVMISTEKMLPFEYDGEIEWVEKVQVSLLKQYIRCCK